MSLCYGLRKNRYYGNNLNRCLIAVSSCVVVERVDGCLGRLKASLPGGYALDPVGSRVKQSNFARLFGSQKGGRRRTRSQARARLGSIGRGFCWVYRRKEERAEADLLHPEWLLAALAYISCRRADRRVARSR